MLKLLECRLDNVVYRIGLAPSRGAARQLVNHGHVFVNGRKTDRAARTLKVGDAVELRERSRALVSVQVSLEEADSRGIPAWLEVDRVSFKGIVRALPTKEECAVPVNEQMVVELYSR